MTSNYNNIESLISEKLNNFESTFSADEMGADWNAVSSQAGISVDSGGQAAQIGQSFSRVFWLKITGALLIIGAATVFFWPTESSQKLNEPVVPIINSSESNHGNSFANESHNQELENGFRSPTVEKPVVHSNNSSENKKLRVENKETANLVDPDFGAGSNEIESSKVEVDGSVENKTKPEVSLDADFQYADFALNNELLSSEFTFCQGEEVLLNRWAADPNGIYRVVVKEPGLNNYISYGRISHKKMISLSLDKPGKYRVAFEKKVGNNWVEAKGREKLIEVVPKPVAQFSVSNAASNVYMFTNQSRNALTQEWRLGTFGTGEVNPIRAFAKTGTEKITLIVSNNQCHDTLVKTLKVNEPIIKTTPEETPNFFAPDASANKFFELPVPTEGKMIGYRIEIRSLETNNLVFESFDSNYNWDGNDATGKACRKGQYYYIVKYVIEGYEHDAITKGGLIHLYR